MKIEHFQRQKTEEESFLKGLNEKKW